MKISVGLSLLWFVAMPVVAQIPEGLLFSLAGDNGLSADMAKGQAQPIFASGAETVPDGQSGPGLRLRDNLALAWSAPGNIQAQRGTLSFFFRPRSDLGQEPFPLFRVAASESSSWDMAWLRIDWNGQGFDAFVTDTNLARTRVSFTMDRVPARDEWVHVAFGWDEAEGVRLWINGKSAAQKDLRAHYDTGLYGFGPFQRIVSPYQVHSMYNFRRSGDIDGIRIYDRRLDDAGVAALAINGGPDLPPLTFDREIWRGRYGFGTSALTPLSDPVTHIRKVEFTDTRDLKARMLRGADGIRETTWPGVYNRSRLTGRNDYFQLPDWNVYSEGGKAYDLTLPDEPWNRIEITGAAFGMLKLDGKALFTRKVGVERTSNEVPEHRGGGLRFENSAQETPIQEIAAYYISKGEVPEGYATLRYKVEASAAAEAYPALDALRGFINGRYVPSERSMAVALPVGAPRKSGAARTDGAGTEAAPVVHLLIPGDFRDTRPGEGPTRFSYGWENMDAGLDGIALDLPALKIAPSQGEFIPLNIRVRDPNWPERDLMDVNIAVKPGEARTLWLDTRDRILPPADSLMISLASDSGFNAAMLNGMQVRLVFKPLKAARVEHIADRLEQARDNLAFFVEEQPNIRAYPLWTRFERDISDVLRVDPENAIARAYWIEKNPEQPYGPAFQHSAPPEGAPLWAWRQVEDLRLYKYFVDWWIDKRQVGNGEFGGGLSDDTDLTNAWVPLAMMGVDPQRYAASQRRLLDATYANGMWSGGLSRIVTDDLHSYEEGINAVAQALQMRPGDPVAVERAMAVAREYPRLFEVNSAGHRHLISGWFSGTHIAREGHLGWQRHFGLLITHPGLLLVDYNGAPQTKKLLLETVDGWLAHGKEAGGTWAFPSDIEWATDKASGNGIQSAGSLFWAAYSWTGDAKYLRPIADELRRGNLSAVSQINADLMTRAPDGPQLAARILAGEVGGQGKAIDRNLGGIGDNDFATLVRWQKTGEAALLTGLYEKEIEASTRRMPVLTEAHLWSDRVSVPTELLQRTRLGGVAHRRNVYYPGNLLRWRFEGVKGEDVAVLIDSGQPTAFTLTAYSFGEAVATAILTADQMAPGQWRITDDRGNERKVDVERGSDLRLDLPSHQSVTYHFERLTAGEDTSDRPDIALSAEDIWQKGRTLHIRVHSLGARPAPAGTAVVTDAQGREMARVRFRALAAPTDLLPKTTTVSLHLPEGVTTGKVILGLEGASKEILRSNNEAEW